MGEFNIKFKKGPSGVLKGLHQFHCLYLGKVAEERKHKLEVYEKGEARREIQPTKNIAI